MMSFWKMGMRPQKVRDEEMRLRVGETAVQAQKVVDSIISPELTMRGAGMHEPRISCGPMHGYAIADLKQTAAGTCSTFAAAEYYNDKAKARRDELIAKFKAEEQ